MTILVYYNVVHKNFTTLICHYTGQELGDFYKINSQLVAIIWIPGKKSPLKFFKRKLSNIKYKLGDFLITTGERVKRGKVRSIKIIADKNMYPWWK